MGVWLYQDRLSLGPAQEAAHPGWWPHSRAQQAPGSRASASPGIQAVTEIHLHPGTRCDGPSQPCTRRAPVGNPTWFRFQFWKRCCRLKASQMMGKSQSEQLLCTRHPAKA